MGSVLFYDFWTPLLSILRLGQARGPSAAATCLILKSLLHLRSMYKIYRRWGDGAGGGSKNRSLGNNRDMIFKKMKFYVFFNFIFFWGGGLNNELSDIKSSDCNRFDDFEIFLSHYYYLKLYKSFLFYFIFIFLFEKILWRYSVYFGGGYIFRICFFLIIK